MSATWETRTRRAEGERRPAASEKEERKQGVRPSSSQATSDEEAEVGDSGANSASGDGRAAARPGTRRTDGAVS